MKQTENLSSFGARLNWLRKKHGLTLAQFGEKVRVGRSYLSKLESGKSTKTSEQFLWVVCDVFNLRWDWLTKGEGPPFLSAQPDGGNVVAPPKSNRQFSDQESLFVDGLLVAGMALQVSSNTNGVANTLLRLLEQKNYSEPLRLEVAEILLAELVCRISQCQEINRGGNSPVSDLGKLAVAAVEATKRRFKCEDTSVDLQVPQETNQKTSLTNLTQKGKATDVKSELEKLIARVKRAVARPGAKSGLARFLKVAPSRITEWLSDDPKLRREPGGYYTLELLKWVEQQEQQK